MQELIKAADRDAHEETNKKATPVLCVRLRAMLLSASGVWIHRTATKTLRLCIIHH